MNPHNVHNLRLDICDCCGGVWFDAGEFGRISRLGSRVVDQVIAEESPNLRPYSGTHQITKCPACSTLLNVYHFAGTSEVMLAGCSQCAGIYVSHDDLLKLDHRDRVLERREGQLPEAEAAGIAQMDGQTAADTFRSHLAQWNWKQLETPVMFS